MRSRRWYVTLLAILMTAFLVVLAAGVLTVMIQDAHITRALTRGIGAYAAAESSLEYALLKIRNHREGFEDVATPSDEWRVLLSRSGADVPELSYAIDAAGLAYSGTIQPGGFAVVPLFVDPGQTLIAGAKRAETYSGPVRKAGAFILSADGDFSWNLIGSDSSGKTYGIVGTGSATRTVGSRPSAAVREWTEKQLVGTKFSLSPRPVDDLVNSTERAYLIIENYTPDVRSYAVEADSEFSYPAYSLIAGARIGDIRQNIALHEDADRLFSALKYSVFNQ